MTQLELFDERWQADKQAQMTKQIEALKTARKNTAAIKRQLDISAGTNQYSAWMQIYRGCLNLEWILSIGIPEDQRP